jgi:hypothetical protein
VIVAATRAGSYEERICLRCFEGRVYDMRDAAEHAQGRFLDGFRRAKRRRAPLRRGPEGVAAATPRVLDPNRESGRTTG